MSRFVQLGQTSSLLAPMQEILDAGHCTWGKYFEGQGWCDEAWRFVRQCYWGIDPNLPAGEWRDTLTAFCQKFKAKYPAGSAFATAAANYQQQNLLAPAIAAGAAQPAPSAATAAALQQAQALALTGGVTYTSAGAGVTAEVRNASRPGAAFQVGDSFRVVVTGPANQAVSNTASQNGGTPATWPYGKTDGAGQFSITGTFAAGDVGTWVENWAVGGVSAGAITFQVSAASAAAIPAGGGVVSTAAAVPDTANEIFGYPAWMVLAGAGIGGFLLFRGRGR